MLNVVICDDKKEALEEIKRIVKDYCLRLRVRDVSVELATDDPYQVLDLFRHVEMDDEGNISYEKKAFKRRLVFLDINMGVDCGFNGIELARDIRAYDVRSQIVFVTSDPSRHADVVNHKIMPLGYVSKPGETGKQRFEGEIKRHLSEGREIMLELQEKASKLIKFKTERKDFFFEENEVYYMKGNNSKDRVVHPNSKDKTGLVILYTSSGQEHFKRPLRDYEKVIKELVKLGRSYLINPNAIRQKWGDGKYGYLLLRDGSEIRVMRQTLMEYEKRVEIWEKKRGY